VTRIDPGSGTQLASVGTGSGATAVTTSARAVWVANRLEGTVAEIDPRTDAVRATVPVGDGPDALSVSGSDIWVGNELSGTLSRIDARRSTVLRTVVVGKPPTGVVAHGRQVFVAVRGSSAAHRGGTLTILSPVNDLTSADLTEPIGPWEAWIVTNDGLTGFRRVGGVGGTQLVPDLAVSLPTPTDGGRSYTFRVRPGIRYSTGALVRPADFRRAIERALVLNSVQGAYFADIVGAEACLAAPKRPCRLDHGIVTDSSAGTVTYHLRRPDPNLLYELALPVAYAVPASTPLHVVGPLPATGPYEFASFDPKHGLVLRRNPWFHEWSPAAQPAGYPDRIVERFQEKPNVFSVLSGHADIADIARPSPELLAALRTQHAAQIEINPWDVTWFLVLNTRRPPFDDVRVRRAVNFAIDRKRLLSLTLGSGLGTVSCQVIPPGLDGYRRYCPFTLQPSANGTWKAPDLGRARALVRASHTQGTRVTVWIPRWTAYGADAGRYVVSVLDRLGFRATYRFHPDPYPHEDDLGLQIGFYGFLPDYAAPAGFIPPGLGCAAYRPNNPQNQNTAEFCDPAIDHEFARARSLQTTDPRAATRMWTKVDHDLTDRAPWVPFANGVVFSVRATRVGGYQYNPQWGTLFDQLWVK